MKKIDCMGDVCPVPVIKLKKELPAIRAGETIAIVTDHSCSGREVVQYCAQMGLRCTEKELMNGVWAYEVSLR